MAHGIAGPLALLSLAKRRGTTVPGHTDAIHRICAWLDTWRRDHPSGPWWPQWVTPEDLHRQQPAQPGPLRPSWCYGTPGIARAQQLAALATGDTDRRHMAEHALLSCLTHPEQLARITDGGLCHGASGLFQTTYRAAADAATPTLAARLPRLQALLRHHTPAADDPSLLQGAAGHALAQHTATTGTAPASGWDACLLLT
ncbi:lanthionine synthetase C family protein [Streptomyces aidingensis]|uniref:Lanthionine synthetase C-like protein n=1 Tax=Streptomyces aidingensis TaxID=910347 RepID=A0A1I1K8L4_9ACTN|nr:lanthionine synthetase C family protein [Streptomyces aidingensis]SFC57219.1 Lanthionine synthetase C-like protein [Streptomyces aidingensis]